ncbi:hypothetical protein B4N89_45200 [Embleya scabrispora]|uniref:Uncharacterized protein n=1 Tax=Embleya scabrispora TaxID=159449 RepID=A0A1T3NIM6_9ACTN|nr:hypothetical protein [Embleya scabrispora]OPC76689.1 hypothetical protein B4N89_45200 [Embleya scabrispora]
MGTVTKLVPSTSGDTASVHVEYRFPDGGPTAWVDFEADRPWPPRGTLCVVCLQQGEAGLVVAGIEIDERDRTETSEPGRADGQRITRALVLVIGVTVLLVLVLAAVIGVWIAAGPTDPAAPHGP